MESTDGEHAASMKAFHQRLARMALEQALTLNALGEGVMRLDTDGRVTFLNPAAARLLRSTADQLVGQPFHQAAHHTGPDHECPICRDIGDGRAWSAEGTLRTRDHPAVPVAWRTTPVTQKGQLVATVVVLQDITERSRSEEARIVAIERGLEVDRLQDAIALKAQFLNMAAHELNTPLTAILLQLAVLRRTYERAPGAADRQASWDLLQRNLERLTRLVEDLLESARMQAGKLTIRREAVDLQAAIGEAAGFFREAASARGVAIVLDLPGELWIEGDGSRINQVLSNLLSNALKFTHRGGHIVIRAEVAGETVRVLVQDNGIGLAPEEVPELFKPFAQVAQHERRPAAGSGLGLYICKGIVEAHGGWIWATSPGRNQGTTVGFAIPLAQAPRRTGEVAARAVP